MFAKICATQFWSMILWGCDTSVVEMPQKACMLCKSSRQYHLFLFGYQQTPFPEIVILSVTPLYICNSPLDRVGPEYTTIIHWPQLFIP